MCESHKSSIGETSGLTVEPTCWLSNDIHSERKICFAKNIYHSKHENDWGFVYWMTKCRKIIFTSTFIYGSIIDGHIKNWTVRRLYSAAYCHYKTQTQIKCLLLLKMSTSSSIMKWNKKKFGSMCLTYYKQQSLTPSSVQMCSILSSQMELMNNYIYAPQTIWLIWCYPKTRRTSFFHR